jgi:hypothetical protein
MVVVTGAVVATAVLVVMSGRATVVGAEAGLHA